MIRIITREQEILPDTAWTDTALLDEQLMQMGLVRSDAGFEPGNSIIAAQLSGDIDDTVQSALAALAVQRAILTIASCDAQPQPAERMREMCGLVATTSEFHNRLLEAEIESACKKGIDAAPPGEVFRYKPGQASRLLLEALKLIPSQTTEQLGVFADLANDDVRATLLPIGRAFTTEANRGSAAIGRHVAPVMRNVLAWMMRNPTAHTERIKRYLRAYDLTLEDLEEALRRLKHQG